MDRYGSCGSFFLSHCGGAEYVEEATRIRILLEYLDVSFKKQRQKFSGYVAQIIQHEMDHLEGIVI